MKRSFLKEKLTVRLSYIAAVFLLVCGMIFPLAGCVSTPETQTSATTTAAATDGIRTLNWQLYGTWISADGTTNSVPFSIDGYIQKTPDDLNELHIVIDLPDDFRYIIGTPTPSFISMNQKYNHFPHLMLFNGFTYDKHTNSSVWTSFALDLEKEYAAIMIENAPNRYCYSVASTDPDADPKDLLAYFEDFFQSFDRDT